jgi:hypothetical protein
VKEDARVLLLADEVDRVGPARFDRERGDVDARDHDRLRRARRETHHAPQELLLRRAARLARGVRRKDAEDLVLRERRLAVRVERQPDDAKDAARENVENPERWKEHKVRRAKKGDRDDGRLGRALDGHELRNELAEEHVEQGQDTERHGDYDPPPRRPELSAGEPVHELGPELGHRRFADPTEP